MRDKTKTFLSKSKYLEGLQCPKLLWYEYNRKDQVPPPDAAQQAIFDEGTKVGEFARKLFPGGIKIERDAFPEKNHEKSLAAAKLGKPLFEAGFVFERTYALADILVPVKGGLWDLYEVKSSTKTKEVYHADIAFQRHVYENAGIKIRKCFLVNINNKYVRHGEINPQEFFILEDVTDIVDSLKKETPANIERLLKVMALDEAPKMNIGPHCGKPYECSIKGLCWDFVPDEGSVFNLYRIGKKAFELVDAGVLEICSIPQDFHLNDNQHIQLAVHKSGKPYIDKDGIRDFLGKLEYPLYFLDFETVAGALPLYDETSPYEQVPFQYSLHVLDSPKAELKHYSFLAPDAADPRPALLGSLKGLLKDKGSIVAYNAPFETAALERAAAVYSEYLPWFAGIKNRIVDLIVPFRSFLYYHPKQNGSNSLKAVLPALTTTSYKGMDIAEGGMASREFLRVTFDPAVSKDDRQRVRAALEKYCALDTSGMVDILRVLKKESGK